MQVYLVGGAVRDALLGLPAGDRDFVRYLLDQAQVAVVSGTGFLHAPYFRVSYAAGLPKLEQATQRIAAAVAALV